MSNNASRSPRDFAVKLMRMLVPTEPRDVITSCHAVLSRLQELGLQRGDHIHVCGTDALAGFIRSSGFLTTKDTDDVSALVVAWNPALVMDDIRRAADVARAGVPFIGANRDATYPSEDGLVPGSGSILAAVETASGKTATVVGKPQPELFRLALDRGGASVERTLFVGDRPDSDVVGARAVGIPVALVFTGVTTRDDIDSIEPQPDFVMDDLKGLLDGSVEAVVPAAPVVGIVAEPVVAEARVVDDTLGSSSPAEGDDQNGAGDEAADVRPERDATLTLFDP